MLEHCVFFLVNFMKIWLEDILLIYMCMRGMFSCVYVLVYMSGAHAYGGQRLLSHIFLGNNLLRQNHSLNQSSLIALVQLPSLPPSLPPTCGDNRQATGTGQLFM